MGAGKGSAAPAKPLPSLTPTSTGLGPVAQPRRLRLRLSSPAASVLGAWATDLVLAWSRLQAALSENRGTTEALWLNVEQTEKAIEMRHQ
jgi:hypothetical protein